MQHNQHNVIAMRYIALHYCKQLRHVAADSNKTICLLQFIAATENKCYSVTQAKQMVLVVRLN